MFFQFCMSSNYEALKTKNAVLNIEHGFRYQIVSNFEVKNKKFQYSSKYQEKLKIN